MVGNISNVIQKLWCWRNGCYLKAIEKLEFQQCLACHGLVEQERYYVEKAHLSLIQLIKEAM